MTKDVIKENEDNGIKYKHVLYKKKQKQHNHATLKGSFKKLPFQLLLLLKNPTPKIITNNINKTSIIAAPYPNP